MTFEQLKDTLPQIIQNKLEGLKMYRENPQWHPEENAYIHVQIVTERCLKTNNKNLICTGILHDICKQDVSRPNLKSGYPMSPGHEAAAVDLIQNNKCIQDWIINMGADLYTVTYLVATHMRIKQMEQMRQFKQDEMKAHELFPLLKIFNGFDNMLSTEDVIQDWIKKGIVYGK